MHRRPSPHRENWAAWVPPPAVEPGWIAGRAPAGRNPHDRVLPYTPPGMKKARPRVGGAVSGRGIRDWKGVRNSSWHCAAPSALVSRSRAMPAGGRRSKPSPRLFSLGDVRFRAPLGARCGPEVGVPWPACRSAGWGTCRDVRHPGTGKYAVSPRCAGRCRCEHRRSQVGAPSRLSASRRDCIFTANPHDR